MDSKTLSKYRLFGKAGKIVMTVLAVIAALITVCCCIATVFVATLPENALTVCVTEHAELRFNSEHLARSGAFSAAALPTQEQARRTTCSRAAKSTSHRRRISALKPN